MRKIIDLAEKNTQRRHGIIRVICIIPFNSCNKTIWIFQ